MFPFSPERISSSVGCGFLERSPTVLMMKPGVQYPHWNALCSANAFWTGCSLPSCSSPSMVVTCLPAAAEADVMQDWDASPSISTVHAPQLPSPQPYFVPVRPSSLRSTLRRLRSRSTCRLCRFPFTVRSTGYTSKLHLQPGGARQRHLSAVYLSPFVCALAARLRGMHVARSLWAGNIDMESPPDTRKSRSLSANDKEKA